MASFYRGEGMKISIIFVAKPLSNKGSVTLGTGFCSLQMSDSWIEKVADKIGVTDPLLKQKILEAKDAVPPKLIKTVSAVKKTNPGKGSIVTIKVGG